LGGLLFWLLTCWAIIDIARKDFGRIEVKAAWAFAALVPFIGPLVCFAAGFGKGPNEAAAARGATGQQVNPTIG
jgi:hypothetical protein